MKLRPTSGLATLALGGVLCAATLGMPTPPAHACGNAEAGDCGDAATDAANEARWMLKRVVAAVRANEPTALAMFTHGEGGFRSEDLYVFCIGPDARMSAHPDARLMGQDARALRDPSGQAFAAELLGKAKEGTITEVHYLYPRPGSTIPEPKTSYVTRVRDQVCGVGYYDADEGSGTTPSGAPASRLAQLRQRLDAGIPANLRPDWAAFLQMFDEQSSAEEAALSKARASVKAAEAALATGVRPASDR